MSFGGQGIGSVVSNVLYYFSVQFQGVEETSTKIVWKIWHFLINVAQAFTAVQICFQ